ncbi:MAG TPA: hypothetical protein VFM53_13745 [Anaeromyxobacteraceae bacterium]|nr:hypothetical protein [Anaeromyxobacteraceae bacterium]
MRTPFAALALLLATAAPAAGAAPSPAPATAPAAPGLEALRRLEAQYAPVDLVVDLSRLAEGDRVALRHLVEASRIVDGLFLRQEWAGAQGMLLALLDDPSPLGRARLAFFLRNKGPWDRLDHDRPFVPGAPPRPDAGTFYPPDSTKEEIAGWMAGLPEKERQAAGGFFTVIRRTAAGLAAVPYAVEYQPELGLAAEHLRAAAAATPNATLRRFLESRAAALLSNDYYESDVAWMELDAPVEPTFGPYETYADGWFNAKAAFEAFVAVRDDAETAKVARLSAELQDIEDHLPMDPAWRNPKLGALSPIRVVNQLLAAGDGRRGVTTAAFNLPNDERILLEKGAKRVMLRNVQQAKFEKVLLPISKVAVDEADRRRVGFDAFFTHILMHELVHGLGPHELRKDGRRTTVREQLGPASPALEEAKADVVGLFALQRLVDRGVLPRELERSMYATFLASAFRSIRFGVNEAHGRGVALQLNWFLDEGGVAVGKDGRFHVVDGKIRAAVESLSREILTIQATGDAARAKALLDRMAVVRPPVATVLGRLRGIPVDIAPRFVTAEALSAR